MSIAIVEEVLENPYAYVDEIYANGFEDFVDGEVVFHNIQPRDLDDEFGSFVSSLLPDLEIVLNFVRRSPYGQEEPNFIHTDEMMGDVTCLLYLNESPPFEDGTTLYDNDGLPYLVVKSKYNRMFCFESDAPHSRNIFANFGEDRDARLVQVAFMKYKL